MTNTWTSVDDDDLNDIERAVQFLQFEFCLAES